MIIELTAAQARTLAAFAAREGTVALHQVPAGAESATAAADVYITPHGSKNGFRIAKDGSLSAIGETLPAPE
jgi:hypothetical protein